MLVHRILSVAGWHGNLVIPRSSLGCALIALFIAVLPCSVRAEVEARLVRHPRYVEKKELARLEALGRPEVFVLRPDAGIFEVDASVVVRADLQRLLHVSLDFERYARMGVPNVVRSHVIEESVGDEFRITWTRMKYGLFSSFQFLRVREYLEPGEDGFVGSQWSLFHPSDPPSGMRDRPLFDRFDGSWYIEPLEPVSPEGTGPIRLYIRYFIRGDFKWWVPPPIIRRITREGGVLERDTVRFLRILTCNAGADAEPDRCKEN